MAADYSDLYDSAGKQYNVDPTLIRAAILADSSENPNAVGPPTQYGRASGLGQFIPPTAKSLGLKDPTNPEEAIPAVARLLSENLDRYGTPEKAILAYHGGTDEANWGPKTQAHLAKVSAAYQNLTNPTTQQPAAAPTGDNFSRLIGSSSPQTQTPDQAVPTTDNFTRLVGATPKATDDGLAEERRIQALPTHGEQFAADDAAIAARNAAKNQPSSPPVADANGPQGTADTTLSALQANGYQPTAFDRGVNALDNFTQQAGRAASFGLSDKVNALVPAINTAVGNGVNALMGNATPPSSFGDTYQNELMKQRGYGENYAAANPIASKVATVLGTVGSVAPNAATSVAAPAVSLGRNLLNGAGTGAVLGGVAGYGNSNDQSLAQTATDTGLGAVGGAALGAAIPAALAGGQYAGRLGRAMIDPFTEAGQNRLANNAITKFAGNNPLAISGNQIVPGSVPTLAEATGNANVANLQRTARDINANPFVQREEANSSARTNLLSHAAGSAQDIEAATAVRDHEAAKALSTIFKPTQTADPSYVNRTIKGILASPAGQRDSVKSTLEAVRDKLTLDNPIEERISRAIGPVKSALKATGPMSATRLADLTEARRLLNSTLRGHTSEEDLTKGLAKLAKSQKIVGPIDSALAAVKEGPTKFQSDPEQLYGVRKYIGDLLDSKASMANPAGLQASRELLAVRDSLDNAITKASPGFDKYLQDYSQASQPITGMKFMQSLNLADAKGNITLQKVQSALRNVNKLQGAGGVNGAKALSPEQIDALTRIRDDLLRQTNVAAGKSLGSNTVQNIASQNMLQSVLPGKVGAFAGRLGPTTIGAGLGAAAGHILGAPEAGVAAGAGIGRVLSSVLEGKNAAVQNKIEDILLNPHLLNTAQKQSLSQYLLGNKLFQGVQKALVPLGVGASRNRLTSEAIP